MNFEALAEKLFEENQKLRREAEFLRGLMKSYVAKHGTQSPRGRNEDEQMKYDWDNWTDDAVKEALVMQTLKLMLKERNTDRVHEEELLTRLVADLNEMSK
jgi:hypothetical protein